MLVNTSMNVKQGMASWYTKPNRGNFAIHISDFAIIAAEGVNKRNKVNTVFLGWYFTNNYSPWYTDKMTAWDEKEISMRVYMWFHVFIIHADRCSKTHIPLCLPLSHFAIYIGYQYVKLYARNSSRFDLNKIHTENCSLWGNIILYLCNRQINCLYL